jgi:signal transduction histidine kinase
MRATFAVVRCTICSMRRLIIAMWLAFALISLGIGALLFDLYRESEHARVARGVSELKAACESISAKYNEGLSSADVSTSTGRRAEMDDVVDAALAHFSGVEGGVWTHGGGFIGYGYPTYGGTTRKTDIPQAEVPAIGELAMQVSAEGQVRSLVRDDLRETVLLVACPLPAPPTGVVAWTLVRIHSNGPNYGQLLVAVTVLLAFVLVSGVGFGRALHGRADRFARLERALDAHSTRPPEAIPPTGDAELDRVVHAVNALGTRLNVARAEAETLSRQMAQSERLASLGRLSASLAHEIRNPLAAMRLKIENAQADGGAEGTALEFTLSQVARLETLVRNLLAMTQSISLSRTPTRISAWVDQRIDAMRVHAQLRHVLLRRTGDDAIVSMDEFHLSRALDNLLSNAIEHAPSNSSVVVEAERTPSSLVVRVRDEGPGVPASVRAHLFEPFVSGRAEGTGLGLAMVRDIVRAHGGEVRELSPSHGACFELEIPCPVS